MKETDKARLWAWREEHLKVYPQPTSQTYNTKSSTGKKVSLHYVNIVLEIGNAKHVGKESYKQNSDELTDKTNEIYLHYYNKRTNN